jgi:hypothetical protein
MALMPMFWGRNDMMVGRCAVSDGEGRGGGEREGEAIGNVERAGRS